MPFVTTYHPGGKKLETNTDAKMKSHPKSATAENNLYNASYYITQKRKIAQRYARQSKTFRGSCAATAKPHTGVCVGLPMTFTNLWGPRRCLDYPFKIEVVDKQHNEE